MQEPTFLILTALAGAPLHGYGVIQQVSELSGGRVRLRPGTLYGALDRLVDSELICSDREEIVDGRLRRYYRLTDTGAGELGAEAERLRVNVEAATSRLGERANAAGAKPRPGAPKPATTRFARAVGSAAYRLQAV
jgi:DNA-binding PadR family transcriptional regulator